MRLGKADAFVVFALGLGACLSSTTDEPHTPAANDLRFAPTRIDSSLPDVDAIGYEVALRVQDVVGRETFTADVVGTFVATRNLDELALDLDGNVVDQVSVSGRTTTHRRDGSTLVIALPSRVAKGATFTAKVKLHGDVRQADGANPNDFTAFGGLMVRQRNSVGEKIFTSLNWPNKARRWLPLRDHPADGAAIAFDVTFPKRYVVLANGKRLGTTDNADGTKTWRYESSTPMPSYDFHVSAYEHWQIDELAGGRVPITAYTYPSVGHRVPAVYGDLPKILTAYEASLGPYAWGSASFIEEPIFGGGMEHASVVSMDETLFANPTSARDTAFHELAHHWSGNLVRIRQWNDFWLSEGFTEYLKACAMRDVYGAAEERRIFSGYRSRAFAADARAPHAIAPLGAEIDVLSIFDAISYQKGALVLRMLERIVGRDQLSTFLRRWFEKHAFEAMTTNDFESELSAATGRDLGPFFDTFVRAPGHPEVRARFADAPNGETDVTVEQVQPGNTVYAFPLDLDFVDAGGTAERVTIDLTTRTTTKRIRLARKAASVLVDPDAYAIVTTAH